MNLRDAFVAEILASKKEQEEFLKDAQHVLRLAQQDFDRANKNIEVLTAAAEKVEANADIFMGKVQKLMDSGWESRKVESISGDPWYTYVIVPQGTPKEVLHTSGSSRMELRLDDATAEGGINVKTIEVDGKVQYFAEKYYVGSTLLYAWQQAVSGEYSK